MWRSPYPHPGTDGLKAVSRPRGDASRSRQGGFRLLRLGLANAIAHARHRLDQLGIARIALDLAAQGGDVNAQKVALAVARAPHLLDDRLVREHLAGMRDERPQQVVLDRREVDLGALARDAPPRQVDPQVAELDDRVGARAV